MSRDGCDFDELKKFRDKLEKLSTEETEKFCKKCARQLAARLIRWVKQRTPEGEYEVITYQKKNGEVLTYNEGKEGGTLRRAWKAMAISKEGNNYEIVVINPTEYASYVEFGHRQEPGRFVPQISLKNENGEVIQQGVRLKRSFVPGRLMLTISERELNDLAPAILQKKLEDFLSEALSDKEGEGE